MGTVLGEGAFQSEQLGMGEGACLLAERARMCVPCSKVSKTCTSSSCILIARWPISRARSEKGTAL